MSQAAANSAMPTAAPAMGVTCGLFRALLMGLLAGSLAWGLLLVAYPVFSLPQDSIAEYHTPVSNPYNVFVEQRAHIAYQQKRNAAIVAMNGLNTTFGAGVLGLCLGAVLGTTSGVSRRSFKLAMMGAMSGGLITMAITGLGGFLSHATATTSRFDLGFLGPYLADFRNAIRFSLATSWLFIGLGIGAGISLTLFTQQRRLMLRATLIAAIAGVLVAAYYPLQSGVFSMHPAGRIVPVYPHPLEHAIALAMWCVFPCTAITLITIFCVRQKPVVKGRPVANHDQVQKHALD